MKAVLAGIAGAQPVLADAKLAEVSGAGDYWIVHEAQFQDGVDGEAPARGRRAGGFLQ